MIIVGLGNIGPKYRATRHNVGWMILDAIVESEGSAFEEKRYLKHSLLNWGQLCLQNQQHL